MKQVLFSAGLLLCLSPLLSRPAQADTIKTFVLSGTYSPALFGTGVADGSFTVNVDTGTVLSVDFDYVGRFPIQTRDDTFYVSTFSGVTELGIGYGGNGNGATRVALSIYVPVTTFVGYTGGVICSLANPCYANSVFNNPLGRDSPFQNGNLSLAPEPSSLSYMVLGAAFVAALPFVRRRLLAPQS